MHIPADIQTFQFGAYHIDAYIPSPIFIKKEYQEIQNTSPYWAQVWPAAKALCEVMAAAPELVENKTVLEIAAGLGLPSLLAARFANCVLATDYNEAAVRIMQQSADYNQYKNILCFTLDWNDSSFKKEAEVVLLSDINYDPAAFKSLHGMIEKYIHNGSTVLLSTPQRLVAKSFMESLQLWCKQTYTKEIIHNSHTVFTSVWLLKK